MSNIVKDGLGFGDTHFQRGGWFVPLSRLLIRPIALLNNSLILLGLAVYIFTEAYQRLLDPQPVEGGLVVIVASVGIAINGSIAYLFFKSRGDLNIRSAFLNMALDALASVGACY